MRVGSAVIALTLLSCKADPKPRQVKPHHTAAARKSPVKAAPSAEPAKPKERLLFSFRTFYKTGPQYKGRVANINKIVRTLNKTRVRPGETFSFNRAVGPRTKKAGFSAAPTYFRGEVVPGIGGGTCQVTSTLYAAALHIDAEVTERRPHSRASSYIKPGLDATVNYPSKCYDAKGPVAKPDKRVCLDLKFSNPYGFDLIFEVMANDVSEQKGKGSLTVLVKGTGKVAKVVTKWRVFGTSPFDIRYRPVRWWKDGRKKLSQSGRPGLRGARVVTITHPDGRKETKTVVSRYSPVPEVWKVGTKFEKPGKEEPQEKRKGDIKWL